MKLLEQIETYNAAKHQGIVKLLEQIETYGILRRKQGHAEGSGDWRMDPYDLRCDADKLLNKIAGEIAATFNEEGKHE